MSALSFFSRLVKQAVRYCTRPFLIRAIDRAIDQGRPLSDSLERRVRNDPEAEAYRTVMLAIDERLRTEAAAFLETPVSRSSEETSPSRQTRRTSDRPASSPFPRTRRQAALLSLVSVSCIVLLFGFVFTAPTTKRNDGANAEAPPVFVAAPSEAASSPGEENPALHRELNESLARLSDLLEPKAMRSPLDRPLTHWADLLAMVSASESGNGTDSNAAVERRDTLYDRIAESNPVCSYLIECYIRPAFIP